MERRKLDKHQKSSMSPQRRQKLEEIGFNWGKEKGQASWDEKYVS
jgi:glutathionylspermidine synthase